MGSARHDPKEGIMHIRSSVLGLAAGAILALSLPAMAAEVEVQMLNKGTLGPMTFEPALVQIQPGDSVHFVATDKGHDAESVPGMLPDGAQPFKGTISQDITVKFDVEGVYVYKCLPHYPMGMVGLVVVGKPTNLDAIKAAKFPPLVQKRLDTLYPQITAQ
jgi:pseudoazurin